MLRQATPRTMITQLCTIALILALTFAGCYKLDPLSVSDYISSTSPEPGGIGNNGVTTMTQLGTTDSGGYVLTTDIFDKSSASVGEAKIEAASDLVSYIASQQFNIPGTTRLSLNSSTGVTVNVTESSDTKYRVTITSDALPSTPVWFLIDNIDAAALNKSVGVESINEAKLVDPTIFAGYVATHIVMLIGNPNYIIQTLIECREEAIANCGSLEKVEDFYLIVIFSLQNGLQIDCYSTCIHDQGRWGFY